MSMDKTDLAMWIHDLAEAEQKQLEAERYGDTFGAEWYAEKIRLAKKKIELLEGA